MSKVFDLDTYDLLSHRAKELRFHVAYGGNVIGDAETLEILRFTLPTYQWLHEQRLLFQAIYLSSAKMVYAIHTEARVPTGQETFYRSTLHMRVPSGKHAVEGRAKNNFGLALTASDTGMMQQHLFDVVAARDKKAAALLEMTDMCKSYMVVEMFDLTQAESDQRAYMPIKGRVDVSAVRALGVDRRYTIDMLGNIVWRRDDAPRFTSRAAASNAGARYIRSAELFAATMTTTKYESGDMERYSINMLARINDLMTRLRAVSVYAARPCMERVLSKEVVTKAKMGADPYSEQVIGVDLILFAGMGTTQLCVTSNLDRETLDCPRIQVITPSINLYVARGDVERAGKAEKAMHSLDASAMHQRVLAIVSPENSA